MPLSANLRCRIALTARVLVQQLQQFTISSFLPSASQPSSSKLPSKLKDRAGRPADADNLVVLSDDDGEDGGDDDFQETPMLPPKQTKKARKAVRPAVLDLSELLSSWSGCSGVKAGSPCSLPSCRRRRHHLSRLVQSGCRTCQDYEETTETGQRQGEGKRGRGRVRGTGGPGRQALGRQVCAVL